MQKEGILVGGNFNARAQGMPHPDSKQKRILQIKVKPARSFNHQSHDEIRAPRLRRKNL